MKKLVDAYFKTSSNLSPSLIHKSYCHDHPHTPSNERLEFLGDSVLSLVISHRLFLLFPGLSEGELTIRRSQLVQTSALAQKAAQISLDKRLHMSRGEEESGGRNNPNLLANTFEAVLGSLFLDSGLTSCIAFLRDIFPDAEILSVKQLLKDPKSFLQEKLQAAGLGTPVYTTVSSTGPDHAKNFVVQAEVNHTILSQGTGLSKQKAETAAAKNALAKDLPAC